MATVNGYDLGLLPGNAPKYDPETIPKDPDSVLRGKTVIFLGSSVTLGYGSCDISFVEFLEAKDGLIPIKNAVNGTTLVVRDEESYIPRMKTIDPGIHADAFVCQLSTNDARLNIELGSVSRSTDRDTFDLSTVAGALEYIASYVGETWRCPLVFYTGTRYDSDRYPQMVRLLYEVAEKWKFTIADLWNDDTLNEIPDDIRKLYILDGIHPTKAGYREWWLETIEKALCRAVCADI